MLPLLPHRLLEGTPARVGRVVPVPAATARAMAALEQPPVAATATVGAVLPFVIALFVLRRGRLLA